jgi:hypothetical protein
MHLLQQVQSPGLGLQEFFFLIPAGILCSESVGAAKDEWKNRKPERRATTYLKLVVANVQADLVRCGVKLKALVKLCPGAGPNIFQPTIKAALDLVIGGHLAESLGIILEHLDLARDKFLQGGLEIVDQRHAVGLDLAGSLIRRLYLLIVVLLEAAPSAWRDGLLHHPDDGGLGLGHAFSTASASSLAAPPAAEAGRRGWCWRGSWPCWPLRVAHIAPCLLRSVQS